MPVDQDTLKHLEASRKGKPRHFVMVCKGIKILNLVVFQKGSIAGKIKEAKEQGTGKVFAGTVVGSGQDVRFQLMQTEYDAPPGKELILKDYLATEADFKCHPSYELVAELTAVPEVDPDDATSGKGPKTAPPTATTTPTKETAATTAPPSPELEQLMAAMTKLTPAIQQAVTTYPARKEEILSPVATFRSSVKDGDISGAKAALLQIGQLLKSLSENSAAKAAATAPTSPPASEAAPTAPDGDPQAAIFLQCREIYSKARAKVAANLKRLETVILESCKLEDGYDPGEAEERATAIYQVLDVLDERLLKVLDKAAAAPDQREQLTQEALDLVDEYLSYATSDPFVTALESNGFMVVGVRRSMVDALGDLARRL